MRLLTARQRLVLVAALLMAAVAVWAETAGRLGIRTGALAVLLVALLASVLMVRDQVHRGDQHLRSLATQSKGLAADIREIAGHTHRNDAALQELLQRADISAELSALERRVKTQHRETASKLHKLTYSPVVEVQALLRLQQLVPEFPRLPLLGGWAIDPSNLLTVAQHVITTRPQLILECGSGSSTVWMANLLRSIGSGRIIALEGQEKYADLTQGMLANLGLTEFAEVRLAPLRRDDHAGTPWYDPAAHADLHDVEVLIVDGPPQSTAKLARYPALPRLRPILSETAVVYLDDANRADEQQTIDRWQAEGFIASVLYAGSLAEMRLTDAAAAPPPVAPSPQ